MTCNKIRIIYYFIEDEDIGFTLVFTVDLIAALFIHHLSKLIRRRSRLHYSPCFYFFRPCISPIQLCLSYFVL